jgi:hypothetical protein
VGLVADDGRAGVTRSPDALVPGSLGLAEQLATTFQPRLILNILGFGIFEDNQMIYIAFYNNPMWDYW